MHNRSAMTLPKLLKCYSKVHEETAISSNVKLNLKFSLDSIRSRVEAPSIQLNICNDDFGSLLFSIFKRLGT